ncbi:MAG: heparinase II/III family protein [Gemmatimonadaceae bacterium]
MTEALRETFVRVRGLSPWTIARVAAWKTRGRALTLLERAGGYERLVRRGGRWAAAWAAEYDARGGIAAWLSRPGAGRWWLPAPAHEWAARTCTPDDLTLAARFAQGTVDLLGSGPIATGNPPRWRLDLYTGREWPLDEASRVAMVRGDGSDLRTVCELSRCYHFLTLARAYWATGERDYLYTFEQHVRSWRTQNPLGYGPLWSTNAAMDLALRLANWALAVPLFAAAPVPTGLWRELLAELVSAGHFLERHPEWHPRYRGSHYVGTGVGMVYLGVLFRGTGFGERWLSKGARILRREILRQIEEDGVSFESALAYHRHHTELFAFGGELVRRNLPGLDMTAYDRRLRRMYAFIDAYLPCSGEAPMLGDADDSRVHALDARSLSEPRRHKLGLPDGYWPTANPVSGAFPRGGFFVLRDGADHAVVRCGRIGLAGAGSHDHNDQLSFELVVAGRRVVADSGAYAYTRNLVLRHAFRSTAAHSVVQVDGEEQNPIQMSLPWRILEDRTRSVCEFWRGDGPVLRFDGRHSGFAHLGATCRRRLSFHRRRHMWRLVDQVDGNGAHDVAWRLHLTPGRVSVRPLAPDRTHVVLPGTPTIHLLLRHPAAMSVRIAESPMSNSYGTVERRPVIEVAGATRLPLRISCMIQPGWNGELAQ